MEHDGRLFFVHTLLYNMEGIPLSRTPGSSRIQRLSARSSWQRSNVAEPRFLCSAKVSCDGETRALVWPVIERNWVVLQLVP